MDNGFNLYNNDDTLAPGDIDGDFSGMEPFVTITGLQLQQQLQRVRDVIQQKDAEIQRLSQANQQKDADFQQLFQANQQLWVLVNHCQQAHGEDPVPRTDYNDLHRRLAESQEKYNKAASWRIDHEAKNNCSKKPTAAEEAEEKARARAEEATRTGAGSRKKRRKNVPGEDHAGERDQLPAAQTKTVPGEGQAGEIGPLTPAERRTVSGEDQAGETAPVTPTPQQVHSMPPEPKQPLDALSDVAQVVAGRNLDPSLTERPSDADPVGKGAAQTLQAARQDIMSGSVSAPTQEALSVDSAIMTPKAMPHSTLVEHHVDHTAVVDEEATAPPSDQYSSSSFEVQFQAFLNENNFREPDPETYFG